MAAQTEQIREWAQAMIEYRWSTGKAYVTWKDVCQALYDSHNVVLDNKCQKILRKSLSYLFTAYKFLDGIPFSEIQERATKTKRTPVEYTAYALGLKIEAISKYFDKRGYPLGVEFKRNVAGRDESQIRKNEPGRGRGDCAVRALSLATGKSYDSTLLKLQDLDQSDPTRGTSTAAIRDFMNKYGWLSIGYNPAQKQSFHTLIASVPKLKDFNLLVFVRRHIYYVEKGTVMDTGDVSSRMIERLFVFKEQEQEVTALLRRVSISGIADDALRIKRQRPNLTWKAIANELGIRTGLLERVRKSYRFEERLNFSRSNLTEWYWIPERCRPEVPKG